MAECAAARKGHITLFGKLPNISLAKHWTNIQPARIWPNLIGHYIICPIFFGVFHQIFDHSLASAELTSRINLSSPSSSCFIFIISNNACIGSLAPVISNLTFCCRTFLDLTFCCSSSVTRSLCFERRCYQCKRTYKTLLKSSNSAHR